MYWVYEGYRFHASVPLKDEAAVVDSIEAGSYIRKKESMIVPENSQVETITSRIEESTDKDETNEQESKPESFPENANVDDSSDTVSSEVIYDDSSTERKNFAAMISGDLNITILSAQDLEEIQSGLPADLENAFWEKARELFPEGDSLDILNEWAFLSEDGYVQVFEIMIGIGQEDKKSYNVYVEKNSMTGKYYLEYDEVAEQ